MVYKTSSLEAEESQQRAAGILPNLLSTGNTVYIVVLCIVQCIVYSVTYKTAGYGCERNGHG